MGAALYSVYAVAHPVLFGLALRLARRRFTWTLGIVLVLAATIAYDNAMIVAGNAIGAGDTLRALTWPRFIIHAFLTPVGIAVVVDQARRLGVGWAQRASRWAWPLTGALIALGVTELLRLELVADTGLGLLRYTAEEPSVPVPAIVTVIVMIVAGWSVRRTTGWGLLFWLGIVTFIGSGAPPVDGMLVLGNLVEIVFVAALLLTEQRTSAPAEVPRPANVAPTTEPSLAPDVS